MNSPSSSNLDIEATLLITPGEATAGARRDVDVLRIVRCTTCLPAKKGDSSVGCDACSDGLTTREQRLSVKVPAGITTGTRLRLSGKGHESTQRPTGNLYLRLLVVGGKADQPSDPKPKLESKSAPARSAPATAKPRESEADALFSAVALRKQRRAKTILVSAAVAVALAGIGAFAYDHASRAELGASCARDGDCRSDQCVGLYEPPPAIPISPSLSPPAEPLRIGFPRRTGGICSDSCKGDEDCPPRMRCALASRSTHFAGLPDLGPGEPNTLVCVSR